MHARSACPTAPPDSAVIASARRAQSNLVASKTERLAFTSRSPRGACGAPRDDTQVRCGAAAPRRHGRAECVPHSSIGLCGHSESRRRRDEEPRRTGTAVGRAAPRCDPSAPTGPQDDKEEKAAARRAAATTEMRCMCSGRPLAGRCYHALAAHALWVATTCCRTARSALANPSARPCRSSRSSWPSSPRSPTRCASQSPPCTPW